MDSYVPCLKMGLNSMRPEARWTNGSFLRTALLSSTSHAMPRTRMDAARTHCPKCNDIHDIHTPLRAGWPLHLGRSWPAYYQCDPPGAGGMAYATRHARDSDTGWVWNWQTAVVVLRWAIPRLLPWQDTVLQRLVVHAVERLLLWDVKALLVKSTRDLEKHLQQFTARPILEGGDSYSHGMTMIAGKRSALVALLPPFETIWHKYPLNKCSVGADL